MRQPRRSRPAARRLLSKTEVSQSVKRRPSSASDAREVFRKARRSLTYARTFVYTFGVLSVRYEFLWQDQREDRSKVVTAGSEDILRSKTYRWSLIAVRFVDSQKFVVPDRSLRIDNAAFNDIR